MLLIAAVCLGAADTKKSKKEKPPDLEILEVSGHRSENIVRLDGRVRNTSTKSITGLVLEFHFMDSDRAVLTSQKMGIDEENLEPGKETSIHVQLNDPVRAVAFQISASDEAGHELRLANSGPFAVE